MMIFSIFRKRKRFLQFEVLISTLQKSKTTSTEVNGRVKDAEVVTQEIMAKCARYTPVARIGSILYFDVVGRTNFIFVLFFTIYEKRLKTVV